MTSRLIVLRPEPGASRTAKRAEQTGWDVIVVSLFAVTPLAWTAPDPGDFDAVLMTSANAARHGGSALARYHGLPLYAVGAQTARAAQSHGFETIISGEAAVAEIAERLRADGTARIFHPSGEAIRPFDESELIVTHIPVYAARHVAPPDLASVLRDDAILLVHSPRAGHYLDELCQAQDIARRSLSLVAISTAALAETGTGWRAAIAADRPTDDAMLAAASALGSAP